MLCRPTVPSRSRPESVKPGATASLRPIVEACGGEWEALPADTLKEEGTGVRVALITLQV